MTVIQFEVECQTRPGQMVHVMGSGPLGDWDVARSLVLQPTKYPVWVGRVSGVPSEGLEFKYVLADAAPRILAWEPVGENRRINPSAHGAKSVALHQVYGDAKSSGVEVLASACSIRSGGSGTTCPQSQFATYDSLGWCPPEDDDEEESLRQRREDSAGSSIFGGSSRGGGREPLLLREVRVEPSIRFGRFHHDAGAFEERYALNATRVLGTGMSGGVVLAVSKATGDSVAVKTLPTEGLSAETLEQVKAEVGNQLLMDSPHICRLLEVFEEPGCLRLVMERMRGPDLFDHLARRGRYTERDAANYIRQMAAAVAYCHRSGVAHRDLKPENFCFESTADDARLKMIDFGLSSICQDMPLTQACGTIYYVAPEVLKQRYCKKCDMWSLGVLAYVLLDGHAPFSGRDDRATVREIVNGRYSFPPSRWSHISAQAKDFIASLLRVDVSKRLDAEAALAHPWLADAAASAGVEELRPLGPGVLRSMRKFSKSNALKRAVLRAIAPGATLERVAGWTEHFEALDADGDGKVAVGDLARHLMFLGAVSAAEAEEISAALTEAEDGRELVSFSAFLAACLSAHVQLDGRQLRDLFERLDMDRSGRVSVENVCNALGDVVDIAQVRAEFGDKGGLTYSDFRWLMAMPGHRFSSAALRQLQSTPVSVEASWKVSTRRAKAKMAEPGEADEAARRENLAWRVMNKRAQGVTSAAASSAEEALAPRPPQAVLSLESLVVARGFASREGMQGMSRGELRAMVVDRLLEAGAWGWARADLEALRDEALAEFLCRQHFEGAGGGSKWSSVGTAIVPPRTPTAALIKLGGNLQELWQGATAAAKQGDDIEAARQENVAWRKIHLEQKRRNKVDASC